MDEGGLYSEFFGVAVSRGPRYEVAVAAEVGQMPFLTANLEMWRFFEPILSARLAEIERRASIADRTRAALFELLPGGRRAMADVASMVGMSTRRLQRALEREDTSFRRVLNDTREQLARHYLTSTDMTGAEISFLLGYDDPNSFFRAFRRWVGQTPEEFRSGP